MKQGTRKVKEMTDAEKAMGVLEAQLGTELGRSKWIEVTQAMVDEFGENTFDTQWIHSDPERAARESAFGGTIAHGFLTLSLCSCFAFDVVETLEGEAAGINYGFNKLRFLSPVPCGSRIRGVFTLDAVQQKSPTTLLRTFGLKVEIEGSDTPALVAEWLSLVMFEDAA